jgi:hypothetical protein
MKKLIFLLSITLVSAADNQYTGITTRNAFSLGKDFLPPAPLVIKTNAPPIKLNLTGIMKYKNLTNVFLYSKDIPKRFITLSNKKASDSGIELLSVKKNLVKINNNGVVETLSFEINKIPNMIGPAPVFNRPVMIKKDKKDDKNKNKDKEDERRENVLKAIEKYRKERSKGK